MKIAVIGDKYVALAYATLLSIKNEVTILNEDAERAFMINHRLSPIKDEYIEKYFAEKDLNLKATTNYKEAISGSKYILFTTPINYDPDKNIFDTSNIEEIIRKIVDVMENDAVIIINSTVRIGFTESLRKKFNNTNIIYSPEFLREGKALYDCLYPSRIIMGEKSKRAEEFANLLSSSAIKSNIPIRCVKSTEAEAIKLFSDAYLANRVAFFNELDTYAELNELNTMDIIEGVCLDSRIGDHYNNPSFGYGGYYLPKSTKQLRESFKGVPQALIGAIVQANTVREKYVADMIASRKPKVVGAYRMIMKTNLDNFKSSAIQNVMKLIRDKGIEVIIYEPNIRLKNYEGFRVEKDLDTFKNLSDVIIANRLDEEISDSITKVYTRDLFGRD